MYLVCVRKLKVFIYILSDERQFISHISLFKKNPKHVLERGCIEL